MRNNSKLRGWITYTLVSLLVSLIPGLLGCSFKKVTVLEEDELSVQTPFPFVLPWDDASSSPSNISNWLHKPAGKFGHILAEEGHLYAGGNRIRFFGVNFSFGACFPKKEDAKKIAVRMAKFGINCVRFHHMDNRFPRGFSDFSRLCCPSGLGWDICLELLTPQG